MITRNQITICRRIHWRTIRQRIVYRIMFFYTMNKILSRPYHIHISSAPTIPSPLRHSKITILFIRKWKTEKRLYISCIPSCSRQNISQNNHTSKYIYFSFCRSCHAFRIPISFFVTSFFIIFFVIKQL